METPENVLERFRKRVKNERTHGELSKEVGRREREEKDNGRILVGEEKGNGRILVGEENSGAGISDLFVSFIPPGNRCYTRVTGF